MIFIASFLVHTSVWCVAAALRDAIRPASTTGKQSVRLRALALGAAWPGLGPASGLLQLHQGGSDGPKACKVASAAPEVSLDTWRGGLEKVVIGIECDPRRLCEDAVIRVAGRVLLDFGRCRTGEVAFRYMPSAHGAPFQFSAKVDGKDEVVASTLPMVKVAPADNEAILAEALQLSIASARAVLATFKPRGISPRSLVARLQHPGPSQAALKRWFGPAKPSAVRALVEGVLRVLARAVFARGRVCSEFGNGDEGWNAVMMYITRNGKQDCTLSDLESFDCSMLSDGRYVVNYCPKWFLADPLVGSRILLHEASHHPPVSSNDLAICDNDPAGGCLEQLARDDPNKAMNNAENIAWYIMDVMTSS